MAANSTSAGGRDRHQGEGEAEAAAAPDAEPALAQQAHQMVRHHDIEEAAAAERGDGEPDRGKAQAEALVQVGADEGEGAPEHAALQRHHQDHGERPAPAQHRQHLADHRAAGAFLGPGDVGPRAHDGEQRDAGCDVDRGQHPEHRAPAQPVADRAAQRRARHQAQRLAAQEAGQGRLAALIAHIVAHPGDGERNDRRAGDAGEEAGEGEPGQRARERAEAAAGAAAMQAMATTGIMP